VADARLDESSAQRPVLRDGVGIERATGAAASGGRIKFDLEVLPAGAAFDLVLEMEAGDGAAEALLAAVLAEWQAGRGAIGGRTARGMGALVLEGLTARACDLDTPAGLDAFLRSDDRWWQGRAAEAWLGGALQQARSTVQPSGRAAKRVDPALVARSWAAATMVLRASGPFLTNDVALAAMHGFDHAPLLQVYDERGEPVLPGSALRGALRAQAERIARTITTLDVAREKPADDAAAREFGRRCPACDPLVGAEGPLTSCSTLLEAMEGTKKRRVIAEALADQHLCLACRLFGSSWLGSRLRVQDGIYLPPPEEEAEHARKAQDFLAIDRFTGGGRDGAKFDAVVLWQPRFQVRLLLENPQPWELGWLALVLRDLHGGLLPVGFGKSKGFGTLAIDRLDLGFGFLQGEDAAAAGLPAAILELPGDQSGVYQTRTLSREGPALAELWSLAGREWAGSLVSEVRRRPRSEELPLTRDTYFGSPDGLPQLYPAEEEHHGRQ